ncbi:DegT/DnrJ/EryC1/StrS family aminotransferase [Bradyrhizobium yuanmingense]|uniref:DegT/DnrJ/EryC1/StrS family aminotransferase n=1 Tax=Bradyrhizobium yuanmingense TaxID=108015 RepID=UPI0034E03AC0
MGRLLPFERAFAAYFCRKYAVAVPSGAIGLLLALRALGRARPSVPYVSGDDLCRQFRGWTGVVCDCWCERWLRRMPKNVSRPRHRRLPRVPMATGHHGPGCARSRNSIGCRSWLSLPRRFERQERILLSL